MMNILAERIFGVWVLSTAGSAVAFEQCLVVESCPGLAQWR